MSFVSRLGRGGIAATIVGAVLLLGACQRSDSPVHPVVLIGIDGASQRVIDDLWGRGMLPTLRRIADEGTHGTLLTDYGKSPVIWTTIATGVVPKRHGITDFVVATDKGDAPVASTMRTAPALWDMLTAAGRRSTVIGWWATWPAEEIAGVMVSDRILHDLERRAYPADREQGLRELIQAAAIEASPFDSLEESGEERDRAVAAAGRWLAPEPADLFVIYFRSPDIASHRFWKYYEPESFPAIDAEQLARNADRIPQAYAAVDAAIGELLQLLPADANVFLMSDHGFRADRRERTYVELDFDALLAHLGYLRLEESGVDVAASQVYTFNSRPSSRIKTLRFGPSIGGGPPEAAQELRQRLAADLARARWPSGETALELRAPHARERRGGADLVVEVRLWAAEETLLVDDVPVPGIVSGLTHFSGMHSRRTHGVFYAMGPDIARGATLRDLDIHDITPTVLYALDLPVAEDSDGEVHREIFRRRLRRPLRTVTSWGERESDGTLLSPADGALVDELRALGYL